MYFFSTNLQLVSSCSRDVFDMIVVQMLLVRLMGDMINIHIGGRNRIGNIQRMCCPRIGGNGRWSWRWSCDIESNRFLSRRNGHEGTGRVRRSIMHFIPNPRLISSS